MIKRVDITLKKGPGWGPILQLVQCTKLMEPATGHTGAALANSEAGNSSRPSGRPHGAVTGFRYGSVGDNGRLLL